VAINVPLGTSDNDFSETAAASHDSSCSHYCALQVHSFAVCSSSVSGDLRLAGDQFVRNGIRFHLRLPTVSVSASSVIAVSRVQ